MDEIYKKPEDCVLLKRPSRPHREMEITEEELRGFGKEARSKPNPCPHIRFYDANNQTEQDILNCNPSKPVVEVGIKFSF